MPVVTCPSCDRRIRLEHHETEKTIECASCGERFGVDPRQAAVIYEHRPEPLFDWTSRGFGCAFGAVLGVGAAIVVIILGLVVLGAIGGSLANSGTGGRPATRLAP